MSLKPSERFGIIHSAVMKATQLIHVTCPVFFDCPDVSYQHITVQINVGECWYSTVIDVQFMHVENPHVDDMIYTQLMNAIDYLIDMSENDPGACE